jgi:hypothetical protein
MFLPPISRRRKRIAIDGAEFWVGACAETAPLV